MIYDCSSSQSCDSASCSYFHTQHFLQPPIFPKNLTNLTDLTDFTILQTPYRQCAGTFRTSYNCATRTGAPIFFRAPCTGCCVAAFRRGWKSGGGRLGEFWGGWESFGAAGRPRARTRVSCMRIWVAGRLESFMAAGGFAENLAGGSWKSESVSGRRASGAVASRARGHAEIMHFSSVSARKVRNWKTEKIGRRSARPLGSESRSVLRHGTV